MKIDSIRIHRRDPSYVKHSPRPPQFVSSLIPCNLQVQRCPVPREQASQCILIMRLAAFGDILMGTPLLAALRQAYPDAHLTWIVGHQEREGIDANPYVDELLIWESSYWKRMVRRLQYPLWLSRVLAFRQELRRRRYDVFVSFQPEEWPLLTLGVAAPVSIGIFDTFKRFRGKSLNPHYQRLYTHSYSAPNLAEHRTDQYLHTLQALGLPSSSGLPASMGYTAEDRDFVRRFLLERGLGQGQGFVVIAPMTTWPTRCWPDDRYVALADALVRRHNCRIIVLGSVRERASLEDISARMGTPPVLAAGELSFRQAAALLDRAAVLVSGDTGPMHVASALGTPQVALFGPTSPQWYGPRAGRAVILSHSVPCGPCDQKLCRNIQHPNLCMDLLSVDEVLEQVSRLLITADLV